LTVSAVAEKLTDGEHIQPRFAEAGVPMLSAKHIGVNGVDLADFKYVTETDASRFRQRCDPQSGDLLIVGRGSIGKTCEVQSGAPVFCLMGSVILLRLSTSLSSKFFLTVFRSSYGQAQLFGRSRAMAQPALYLRDVQHLLLPIPPLAEQKRIVAKVEQLMKLCDALEAALRHSEDRAAKLVEAVVQEMVA
jgi:type I restriction enzyme S subunit